MHTKSYFKDCLQYKIQLLELVEILRMYLHVTEIIQVTNRQHKQVFFFYKRRPAKKIIMKMCGWLMVSWICLLQWARISPFVSPFQYLLGVAIETGFVYPQCTLLPLLDVLVPSLSDIFIAICRHACCFCDFRLYCCARRKETGFQPKWRAPSSSPWSGRSETP